MTAQVPDTVEVDGVRYSIAGVSGTGLFDPKDHGVEPRPISTGCWRGFVCRYAVVGDAFRLAELHLGLGSALDGEQVTPETVLLGATPAREGGEHVFRYDGLDVAFTGTLLAGEGFVQSTYVHMGYAPAWKFERVLRLTVEAGRVTAREDLSEQMARTRESIVGGAVPDPDGDRSDVRSWIARTFRLGIDRSTPRPARPPD